MPLAHLLLDRPMQKRFESDPHFQATLLLLQERVPKSVTIVPQNRTTCGNPRERRRGRHAGARHHQSRDAGPGSAAPVERPLPRDGDERRRRAQPVEGSRDQRWARTRPATTGALSATSATSRAASTGRPRISRQAGAPIATRRSSEGRAEFRRRDHGLDVHTEIAVSPEDDVELRRSRIVNRSRMRKVIEITTRRCCPCSCHRRCNASGIEPLRRDRDRATSGRSCARAARARLPTRRPACFTS